MSKAYWCDGSGWNGRKSCFLVADEDYNQYYKEFDYEKTSNEMEYAAIIRALHMCDKGDAIYTDSQLIANQLNGKWQVGANNLRPLYLKAKELKIKKRVRITWISRNENYAGIELEKRRKI